MSPRKENNVKNQRDIIMNIFFYFYKMKVEKNYAVRLDSR